MGTADRGDASEPALRPGTGLDRFVRLRSGDILDWIAGPQGGHHVFGGISVAGEVLQGLGEDERDDVVSGYRLLDAEDEVVASALRLGGLREEAGRWKQWAVLMVLRPGISPHALSREALTFEVFVELPQGDELRSAVSVGTRCCL